MIDLKYIRFAGLGFVVFPDSIYHRSMAGAFGHRPISAGFIMWSDGKPICHGGSLSLELEHGPTDTRDLQREWGIV